MWGGDPSHEHDFLTVEQRTGTGGYSAKSTLAGFTNPNTKGRAMNLADGRVEVGFCPCGAWRGELGQEPTPDLYVAHLVSVFREARRVLRSDGVLLLNIGDSYAGSGKGQNADGSANPGGFQAQNRSTVTGGIGLHDAYHSERDLKTRPRWPSYAKPKDLLMIPHRVAIALQADGWWVRMDNIWSKPSCMPESVKDRCTRAHEYVFHLTKSDRYFWNQDAIREPLAPKTFTTFGSPRKQYPNNPEGQVKTANWHASLPERKPKLDEHGEPWGANKRSVWTIPPGGFADAHFATMPPALAELCILATTRPGDTVLDPFGGAGTTALEADRHGRNAVSIELKPEYAAMQRGRLVADAPMFAELSA